MSDPNAASPANGAASKTDTPQNLKEYASAEKPARFAVGRGSHGVWFIFQDDGFARIPAITDLAFDAENQARAVCSVLNAVYEERFGDNPSDVQRQLLEELRELVKLQRTSLTKMTSVVEDQLALQREAMGKSAQGETKRPEPNVNDLMIEVARGFGLSDAASRSIGDLKGFCAAAYDMQFVPKACQRPLLMLAVRDMFGAKKGQIARAAAAHMGIEIG